MRVHSSHPLHARIVEILFTFHTRPQTRPVCVPLVQVLAKSCAPGNRSTQLQCPPILLLLLHGGGVCANHYTVGPSCACDTISIALSGGAYTALYSKAGQYTKISATQDGRAVYQQTGGTAYLSVSPASGAWRVGPDYTTSGAWLATPSGNCPEAAGDSWQYSGSGTFAPPSGGVEVKCRPEPPPSPPPNDYQCNPHGGYWVSSESRYTYCFYKIADHWSNALPNFFTRFDHRCCGQGGVCDSSGSCVLSSPPPPSPSPPPRADCPGFTNAKKCRTSGGALSSNHTAASSQTSCQNWCESQGAGCCFLDTQYDGCSFYSGEMGSLKGANTRMWAQTCTATQSGSPSPSPPPPPPPTPAPACRVLISRQTIGESDSWLRADAEWSINPLNPSAAQFSILDQLEGMGRNPDDDNKILFELYWPELEGTPKGPRQLWKQSSNPVTGVPGAAVEGFEAVDAPYIGNYWGGAAAQRPIRAARRQHPQQLVVRRWRPEGPQRRHSRPKRNCCQPDRALRAHAVRVALSTTAPRPPGVAGMRAQRATTRRRKRSRDDLSSGE